MNTSNKKVSSEVINTTDVFCVCNDDNLTQHLKKMIESENWEDIRNDNAICLANREDIIAKDDLMSLAQDYINKLNENKNITQLLPLSTRFGFIKKIINKLMKVFTRYQEQYNCSNTELIVLLCSEISDLKKQVNKNLEDQMRYQKQLNRCNKKINNILNNKT